MTAADILEKTTCFHCDSVCEEAVWFNGKSSCCDGCRTVYEILDSNHLCDYYSLSERHMQAKRHCRPAAFAWLRPRKSKLPVALLGAINGLPPCGLTSIALASCLTPDRVVDGFSFMLLFGAGTLPAMLGLTGIVAWFARKHVLSTQALMTVLLIVSGCLLIIRVLVMTHHSSGTGSGFAEILCK
jgi:hypothetical protein